MRRAKGCLRLLVGQQKEGFLVGKLTLKQQQIYEYILSFTEEHGYPPSVREIGDHLGLKSPSTVHFHLKGLRAAGLISQAEGKTRSITVTGEHPRSGKIPVLGNVAAGAPILAQECIEEYITYRPDNSGDEHFALRVRGESMLHAGILPGDLVVVKPASQAARNGEIVVALFEDEATVKTYRREADGQVWLLPENPDYEPIDGNHAQIIGRVTAVLRRY